ncbi:MAG: cell division topological specificity factor MinE [Christensenellales bacterium]
MPRKQSPAGERLRKVVVNDKIGAIESMLRAMKSEQYKLLTNYMYLNPDRLKVYIDILENGEYALTVRAVTDRLIDIGRVL